ncbi:Hpt domain-containing protein [Natrinema salsiterrestre]|uniref:Chemotaxis protein CheA n=1 Tax=Natrinema salsiterrestre TaxID=2950540 RepID=A0A9Q4Q3N0_9EURY|nr:Hpt domain-containing protein [Natrinema salsiterrestre]MDF9746357.1 Hpt domain-containing protein [Natrinema salsiterrestre]
MTDYLTDFVQESEERITELNNALLTLERDPDNEEAMENIFRIAHTLKGNCGAMGLESASDLAHAIEDLLDAVRADEIPVTTELMDSIFDAVDELETMVDEVADDGEIETDPSATIRALRDHLAESDDAVAGITRPAPDEIADVCSRFDPPGDDDHDVYLARLAIAEEAGVNNGKLVVDALIDAFDLIGTDPPRETIESAEYGHRFDAVFATAVGEAAIASGLEPVEEVDDFEIVDATDGFDEESAPAQPAEESEPGSGISSDEAQDLEVDDLLDEFDEFDDLDEMVEDVEDEDLDAFEDMGEAGSFDDLLDDAAVDELDAEPGEPPADSLEDDANLPEPESADAAGSGVEPTEDAEDEEVEDAGAVFNELKDEVEMVGFDELQDELEELEFDEFDDEEEVDMDELLGDEADDDSFLEDVEPSEDAVDDILVDADPADDGESASDGTDAVEAAGTEETTAGTDADVTSPANGDGSDATDAVEFGDDDGVAATDTEDDAAATASEADASSADGLEASSSTEDDDSQPADSEAAVPSGGPSDGTDFESETSDDVLTEEDAVADATSDGEGGAETTTDEPVADGTVADDTVADEADSGAVVDADIGDDGSADAGAVEDPSDAGGIEDPTASPSVEDESAEETASGTDTDDENEETDDATAFDSDEVATSPSAEESAEPVDEPATADLETDESATPDEPDDAAEAETVDESASESFGDAAESGFEPTATFDDDLESAEDDSDPFEDAGFSDADDDFEDVGFSDPDDDAFDDPLEEQPDDAFAGTDEFDTADSGFDSTADPETGVESSLDGVSSFGDDAVESDDDDGEEDVVRTVEEPEMEIPDISLPETSDRPDAEDEAGQIQSVRVDVEQIDSLLTLVEGLVTSRVRLRHAADETDEGAALEKELDALSDLTTDLQETVMDIRLVPLQTVTNRLPRVVRDIARDQDKEVAFEMTGEDVELDRSILDRIGDPLIHLVRNAVDHGIEPPAQREEAGKPREGAVEVRAERARDQVTITVEDDGSGLDPDRLRSEAIEAGVLDAAEAESMPDGDAYELIFHPGLSTADEVTDVSGRGVGMDVVKRTIEDLDGTVSVDSDESEGTTVTMTLPVTVAIDEILFVESGGEEFGIPTKAVQDIEPATAVETIGNESVLAGENGEYPVIQLADVLETPAPGGNGNGMVVRIRDDVREVALHCDHVEGQQEVVVKPFEGVMGGIPGLSGATVRGRGEVVNILDVSTL